MSRSLKKGPFADAHLLKKIEAQADLLRYSDYCRAHRCRGSCHLAYRIGDVLDFRLIFFSVPLLCAFGRILEIIFAVIVYGIEEIFQVVKAYAENLITLVAATACEYDYGRDKDESQ